MGRNEVPTGGLRAVELHVSGDSWHEWVRSQVVPVHLSASKKLFFVMVLSVSESDFSDMRSFKAPVITLGSR